MNKNEKKIIDFSTFATQCSIFPDRRSRSVLIVDAKRLKAQILIIIKLLIYFSLVGLSAEPQFNNVNNHSASFGGSYVEFA